MDKAYGEPLDCPGHLETFPDQDSLAGNWKALETKRRRE